MLYCDLVVDNFDEIHLGLAITIIFVVMVVVLMICYGSLWVEC